MAKSLRASLFIQLAILSIASATRQSRFRGAADSSMSQSGHVSQIEEVQQVTGEAIPFSDNATDSAPLFGPAVKCRTALRQIEWQPGERIYKTRPVIACDAFTPWWKDVGYKHATDERKQNQQPFVVTIDKELKQHWKCRYNKFHMLSEPLFKHRNSWSITRGFWSQAAVRHYQLILMKVEDEGQEDCPARLRIDLTQTTHDIEDLISKEDLTSFYKKDALKIIINFSPLDHIYPPSKDKNLQDSTFAHLKEIRNEFQALAQEGNDTAAPVAYEELSWKSPFQRLGETWRHLVQNEQGVSLKNIYKIALEDSRNIYGYTGLSAQKAFLSNGLRYATTKLKGYVGTNVPSCIVYAYRLALLVGFVHDRDESNNLLQGVVKEVFSEGKPDELYINLPNAAL